MSGCGWASESRESPGGGEAGQEVGLDFVITAVDYLNFLSRYENIDFF